MRSGPFPVRAALLAVPCVFFALLAPAACSFDGSGDSGGEGTDGPPAGGTDAGGGVGGGGSDGGGFVDAAPGQDAAAPPDGAPPPDADPGDACGGQCSAPGTCEEATGTCVFVCAGDGSGGGGDDDDDDGLSDDGAQLGGDPCDQRIVCPAGIPCRVECTGRRSCGSGIDCTSASSCDLRCIGRESCEGPLDCGQGSCVIDCDGQDSCTDAIQCQNACVCDVDCHPSACTQPATCPAGCDAPGDDCRTTGECDSCTP
jgi:hypothetical protein